MQGFSNPDLVRVYLLATRGINFWYLWEKLLLPRVHWLLPRWWVDWLKSENCSKCNWKILCTFQRKFLKEDALVHHIKYACTKSPHGPDPAELSYGHLDCPITQWHQIYVSHEDAVAKMLIFELIIITSGRRFQICKMFKPSLCYCAFPNYERKTVDSTEMFYLMNLHFSVWNMYWISLKRITSFSSAFYHGVRQLQKQNITLQLFRNCITIQFQYFTKLSSSKASFQILNHK